MSNKLLIVGAGSYGFVALEIAKSMNCFELIQFIDDEKCEMPDGMKVVGRVKDIVQLAADYDNVIVAIGNPEVRLSLIHKIENDTDCKIATLISPHAFISPSAKISEGCIVEPLAVVHTGAMLSVGCIVSAGAVVNHNSKCMDCVHVDCNAVVAGNIQVPPKTKVKHGEVFYGSAKEKREIQQSEQNSSANINDNRLYIFDKIK